MQPLFQVKKATVIDAAKKLNCTKVAFGHHSDDAVETLLMNAIHGGKLATFFFLPKMYMSRTDTTFYPPAGFIPMKAIFLSALERKSDSVREKHLSQRRLYGAASNEGYAARILQELSNGTEKFHPDAV